MHKYRYKYEVIFHPSFENELVDVYIKYSNKKEIIEKKIAIYTLMLSEKGPKVLVEGAFDKVKKSRNIYEMRLIKKNPNLRILFAFLTNNQIVYLVIFYEKNKSDYDKNIELAENRLKDYM
ncbi:MAG: hypothetical protein PWP54_644 [Thermosipho sp. (in: thermotogales)]|nr:hypothetical protein [Thermosipho sp. (in: thermotogales)]MDN5324607.1 hypothetical protein [Thermosipho sp. (in: thermotogales)]